jgi:hypothetical protein
MELSPAAESNSGLGMSARKDSDRPPTRDTSSAATELTATLWCVVVLLALPLLIYWWASAIYG